MRRLLLPTLLPTLLALFLCLLAQGAGASDFEREKRWAAEIVPALVVGDPVYLKAATGKDFLSLLTEAKNADSAVVIVHGTGVHPDHGVIGSLRVTLADAGITTLAIQMPIAAKEATVNDYYPQLFPDASNRIAVAAAFLQKKGYRKIALVSRSMGSWMSNVYLDETPNPPYAAWVCMGLTGGFTARLFGISFPMLSVKIPILDIFGENDATPGVVAAAGRRLTSLEGVPGSRQVRIAGADHYFNGKENELAVIIAAYLKERWSKQ